MAKVLKQYHPEEENPSGRPPTYPWHLWLDGQIWEIKQGEDFHCEMSSMEGLIRRTASNYDIPLSVLRKDETTFILKPRS